MNLMLNTRLLSPDAPDGGGAPEAPAPLPAPAASEATTVPAPASDAPAPTEGNTVSRDQYDTLVEKYNRAEGRAKTSQRLASTAQQYGFADADDLARRLPTLLNQPAQQQPQPQQPENPGYYHGQYSQQESRPSNHSDQITPSMIDERINSRLEFQTSINDHNLGRESENQMIARMITESSEFKDAFSDLDAGDYGSVFNAAYSGGGSAASEIIASAIDNAIYGAAEKYGDNHPSHLQGRPIPIKDPVVIDKVKDRVIEGIKELAAMTVFAASKEGLVDSVMTDDSVSPGTDVDWFEAKDKRAKEIAAFAQQNFEKMANTGQPQSS